MKPKEPSLFRLNHLMLVMLAVISLFTLTSCDSGDDVHGQGAFQAQVQKDRDALFGGLLLFRYTWSMKAGEKMRVTVQLRGLSKDGHRNFTAHDATRNHLPPRWRQEKFQVGGIEEALLVSDQPEVKVDPLGSGARKQLIVKPGDTAEWAWVVSADKPGRRSIYLSVVTYQGASDRALSKLGPVELKFRVTDSGESRLASVTDFLSSFGAFIGGLTGILLGIFASRGQIQEYAKEKKESWRMNRQTPAENSREGYL